MPWLIYGPLRTHNHYNRPALLCARVAVNQIGCRRYLGPVALWSIFIEPLTLTLFPSIKNLPDSGDGCRVFALRCSPGATWAAQCRRAVKHATVQLLDFHITIG